MNNTTEPVLFVLWFRRTRKDKWTKIGRFSTRAEALTHCRGSGDFHVAPLVNPDLAGEGLFGTVRPTGTKPGPFPAPTD